MGTTEKRSKQDITCERKIIKNKTIEKTNSVHKDWPTMGRRPSVNEIWIFSNSFCGGVNGLSNQWMHVPKICVQSDRWTIDWNWERIRVNRPTKILSLQRGKRHAQVVIRNSHPTTYCVQKLFICSFSVHPFCASFLVLFSIENERCNGVNTAVHIDESVNSTKVVFKSCAETAQSYYIDWLRPWAKWNRIDGMQSMSSPGCNTLPVNYRWQWTAFPSIRNAYWFIGSWSGSFRSRKHRKCNREYILHSSTRTPHVVRLERKKRQAKGCSSVLCHTTPAICTRRQNENIQFQIDLRLEGETNDFFLILRSAFNRQTDTS